MPVGILLSQNSIGSPKTCALIPAARRCACAERPYGPAPMMTTSQSNELFNFGPRCRLAELSGKDFIGARQANTSGDAIENCRVKQPNPGHVQRTFPGSPNSTAKAAALARS